MNILTVYLGYSFTVGVPEMIIFLLAAILLGFSIHFYWSGRKSLPGMDERSPAAQREGISQEDEWRLQFYEQLEKHEKNEERLEKELLRMSETEKLLLRELEETRDEVSRLEELVPQAPVVPVTNTTKHISDLVVAQQNLNEFLSKEMTERLEKVYEEFNFLQETIQKLQLQVVDPQRRELEFKELEQSYFRITKEYDELKTRHIMLMEDHQRQTRELADTDEKLRDANFHKQQLAKRVTFLEELAGDLQQVSGHHKKLEGQLRRITEIESLLSRAATGDMGRK